MPKISGDGVKVEQPEQARAWLTWPGEARGIVAAYHWSNSLRVHRVRR
jgi:hypothetical protein